MSAPQSIAHYRLSTKLGEGGMGAVYRATDTKLNREVAVKILPDSLAGDADRLARFSREAQILAGLNHPNIATIFGVEDSAIVMELVEGQPLSGPLEPERALPLIHQLIDALEYAHEKGIIHRDLKPANILISHDGRLKVLDFGLAKALLNDTSPAGNPNSSPTFTMGATQAGLIMGTAAYMAPEQARGTAVDRRADIWSFGVVVYELLTGKRLFHGETVSDILAAVIRQDIDLSKVPSRFQKLLQLCLTRDVRQRLRDISGARLLLDETPAVAIPASGKNRWTLVFGVASMVLAIALLYRVYQERRVESPSVMRVAIPLPENARNINTAMGSTPVISPDGRHLVIPLSTKEESGLWLKDLDANAMRLLPGTTRAAGPFWSPDSRSVAFFSESKLKRIDIAGGPALALCDAGFGRGGSWNKRGEILFSPNIIGGLWRIAAAGGSPPEPLTQPDKSLEETSHRLPWFLPDDRHYLYVATAEADPGKTVIYVGDLQSKERRKVLQVHSPAIYVSAGYLLFARDRTVMAQPFDLGKLQLSGEPVAIAEQIDFVQNSLVAQFSVSQIGSLAFTSGMQKEQVQLAWLDRKGQNKELVGTPYMGNVVAISPDGSLVAVDRIDPQTNFQDIWIRDLARGSESRLTSNNRMNSDPIWSPDGTRLVFSSAWSTLRGLFQKSVRGPVIEGYLDKTHGIPLSWTPDGNFILKVVRSKIAMVSVSDAPGAGSERSVEITPEQNQAKLSPDGRWLAYQSGETKRSEIYVVSFPEPGVKVQVSTNGGAIPVWSRDGRELYFADQDDMLVAVDVRGAANNFVAGVPKPLFEWPHNPRDRFDVSRDGRFLMPLLAEVKGTPPVHLILNWTGLPGLNSSR